MSRCFLSYDFTSGSVYMTFYPSKLISFPSKWPQWVSFGLYHVISYKELTKDRNENTFLYMLFYSEIVFWLKIWNQFIIDNQKSYCLLTSTLQNPKFLTMRHETLYSHYETLEFSRKWVAEYWQVCSRHICSIVY